MGIHTGEKPINAMRSLKKCELGRHKQIAPKKGPVYHLRMHMGEMPYQYYMCNKQFALKGHLGRHMMIHTGEKPYCCDTCKKAVQEETSLANHRRIHTGEKPFQ